jgi:ABC-2 type transport system ATP-binding protein
VIHVAHLTKYFGRTAAVDNVSFDVKKGEVVGFLGPNGAGKTTTMRIIAGFLPASGGTVRIAGHDVFSDSLEVRRRIGYLPETVPLYPEMRVSEYLRYRGHLKGLRGAKLRERLGVVLACCELEEATRAIIGHLSKGYRQRVGLADSLLHDPQLLILDEPTIGLDPNQIRHTRSLIKELGQRHTIFLSSHILSEVEMVCQRVLIIDRGRIVASDATANLVGLVKGNPHVVLEVQGPPDQVSARLSEVRGVVRVVCAPVGGWQQATCECAKGLDLRVDLAAVAAANRWTLRELRMEKRHLEDFFVEITAGPAEASGEKK